jgi:hypothetical protein
MSVDFSALLSEKLDDVKRPPVKPPGTYHAVIADYKMDVTQKGVPFIQFSFSGLQPGEDIDESQLVVDGERIDLTKWKPSTRGLSNFYVTAEAKFRLKEFLEELGINTSGRTFNETLPECKGMPVKLRVSMQATQDGKGFFNQIDGVEAAK